MVDALIPEGCKGHKRGRTSSNMVEPDDSRQEASLDPEVPQISRDHTPIDLIFIVSLSFLPTHSYPHSESSHVLQVSRRPVFVSRHITMATTSAQFRAACLVFALT